MKINTGFFFNKRKIEKPKGFPENTGSSTAESSLTLKKDAKSFSHTRGVVGQSTSKAASKFFRSSSVT